MKALVESSCNHVCIYTGNFVLSVQTYMYTTLIMCTMPPVLSSEEYSSLDPRMLCGTKAPPSSSKRAPGCGEPRSPAVGGVAPGGSGRRTVTLRRT